MEALRVTQGAKHHTGASHITVCSPGTAVVSPETRPELEQGAVPLGLQGPGRTVRCSCCMGTANSCLKNSQVHFMAGASGERMGLATETSSGERVAFRQEFKSTIHVPGTVPLCGLGPEIPHPPAREFGARSPFPLWWDHQVLGHLEMADD